MNFSSFWNYKRTIDDRGQSVACRSPQAIQRQASRDVALAATADRITSEARAHFSMWHGVAFGMSIPLLMIGSEMLLPSDPIWLRFVPLFIIVPIAGSLFSRYYWRKVTPGLTRILIEEGICASCMYPLEGLSEDSQGMLVCPECSASWRRSRVLRFVPVAHNSTDRTTRTTLLFLLRNMRSGFDRRGIRDDRNSPRAVIALRTIRNIQRNATSDHEERLLAAAQVLRPKGRVKRFALAALFGVILASMIGPFMLMTRLGSSLPLFVVVPVVFAGAIYLTMAFLVLFSDLGRSSKLVRHEFLTKEMCPCCAADLNGRLPESDDCVTCANCGAVWRMHRSKPPSIPPPSPSAASTHQTPPSA